MAPLEEMLVFRMFLLTDFVISCVSINIPTIGVSVLLDGLRKGFSRALLVCYLAYTFRIKQLLGSTWLIFISP